MLKKPLEGRRNGIYWHILQTHAAAAIAFKRYVDSFPKESRIYMWARQPNNSEKCVYLTGGREIHFKSGQNYEDLRAETLDGAIIDECRQQRKELWTQIVRPMLGRYKGWCDFYSTPNGFDWFHDLKDKNLVDPEWAFFHAPSWEAWWWTPEEIASAKRNMSEPEFAQEIGAEFRHFASGLAYHAFDKAKSVVHTNPFTGTDSWSPHLPIAVAMDFNVSPMAWTLGQFKTDTFYWGNEIVLSNSNTPEAADALVSLVAHHPSGIEIIGDASGKARRSNVGSSDYDIITTILRKHNIKFVMNTPLSNPLVKDRVNIMNVTMKNAEDKVSMYVHQRCDHLIRDFERVVLKPSTSDIFVLDKTMDAALTHSSDGVGYYVYAKVGKQFDLRPSTIRVMWR